MHEAGQRVQGWAAQSSPSALGTSHGAEQGAKKCPVLGEQQTSAGQCWLGISQWLLPVARRRLQLAFGHPRSYCCVLEGKF